MDWVYEQQRFAHASSKASESLLGSERDEERCWEWWPRELVSLWELLELVLELELLELLLLVLDDESLLEPLLDESDSGTESRSSRSKDA